MGKTKVLVDTRDLIMDKMIDEGRTMKWLSDKTDINYNTLYSILKRKIFPLTLETLASINFALGTKFKMS